MTSQNNTPALRFKNEEGAFYPEWKEKRLVELIEFINGKGHEQFIDDNGKYIVVNSKFVSTEGRVKKYCKSQITPLSKGDIVMVMSDVPKGKALAKCFLIDKNNLYTLNQRICALKQKSSANEFLIYLINRNEYYLSFDSGVGQTNLKKEDVLNCPLIIPSSIKEQQKIASFLFAIDERIKQLAAKKELLEQYKIGVMQQLFSGKLRFKDENGRAYPKWESVALIDVADRKVKWSFTGGPFGSNLKAEDYTDKGVRILQLQNIGDGIFHNDYKIYTSEQKADELISCNIYPGEILISKMGDPVARACRVPSHDERYLMASDGIRFLPDSSKYDIDFIFHSINHSSFRNKALSLSTGSTRKRIGLTELKTIEFSIPVLSEQKKIAKFLSGIDSKIENIAAQVAYTQAFKKGLLQQMFV